MNPAKKLQPTEAIPLHVLLLDSTQLNIMVCPKLHSTTEFKQASCQRRSGGNIDSVDISVGASRARNVLTLVLYILLLVVFAKNSH